jgi:hypothetical protein
MISQLTFFQQLWKLKSSLVYRECIVIGVAII